VSARKVSETRAARNAARASFTAQVAQIRSDIEARSVGGRIADKVTDDARTAVDQALVVAEESKWIVAGTAGALLLWFLRNPLIGWIAELVSGEDTAAPKDLNDE
jgi:uncharacterized oligopeptide transporter (OPT) family protein